MNSCTVKGSSLGNNAMEATNVLIMYYFQWDF